MDLYEHKSGIRNDEVVLKRNDLLVFARGSFRFYDSVLSLAFPFKKILLFQDGFQNVEA